MASTIKVDNVQNQPGTNVINKCGTTVTLGASGDTVSLASGASQSGFGRSGSVNWDTSIKTSTFTAVSGNGYFCNTAGGAFTVNLPSSPSVGDIVAVKDYSGSFSSDNLTIGRGGSNMNGSAADSIRSTNNESLTLVYADSTKGWLSVEEGTGYVGENFITATGGTITTSGNCKIHTFTGPGTFTVCSAATCAGNNLVSYLVVAGGGGAAGIGSNNSSMGGGGAGGFRETKSPTTTYTASPLDGYPTPGNRITVSETSYPIAVGSGGAGGSSGIGNMGASGAVSTFSTISSAGGGYGSGNNGPAWVIGAAGGSGGGGLFSINGAAGNTPPVTPPQGNAGGNGVSPPGGCGSAGGGGAGAAGTSPPGSNYGVVGGIGAGTEIAPASGTPGPSGPLKYFAGGGSGAPFQQPPTIPGTSGGGGGNDNGPSGGAGDNGTANTGGGAGGTNSTPGSSFGGASGGSGIVVIRYKYQ